MWWAAMLPKLDLVGYAPRMGWVEERQGRNPRACFRDGTKIKRVTLPTVEACEEYLQEVEGSSYTAPAERHRGRRSKGQARVLAAYKEDPEGSTRLHTPSLTEYVKRKCRCDECRAIYNQRRKLTPSYERAKHRPSGRARASTPPENEAPSEPPA